MANPLIFHVDVNSAFLSWESADRIKKDPNAQDLRLINAVIGGDEEMRHGVVLAKSPSAKKYGIMTGEPLAQARKKCPNLVVAPPNHALYVDYSKKFISTYSFGFVWFLIVLFLCRSLLSYLNLIFNKQQLLFVTCLLSLIGYIAGNQFHMIFAFDIVLTVIPLCLSGQYIKKWNLTKHPLRYGLYALFIWTIGFFLAHPVLEKTKCLHIFIRRYPLYPLCLFTAIAGTVFFCSCCIIFSKIGVSKFFSFTGKHTLIYLLVHYFDFVWKPLWDFSSDQYIKALFRLLTDTIIFLLIMLLKYIFTKNNKILQNVK